MKIEEINKAVIAAITMMIEDENSGYISDYESILSLLEMEFDMKGYARVQFVIDTLFQHDYIKSQATDKYELTEKGRRFYFMEIER